MRLQKCKIQLEITKNSPLDIKLFNNKIFWAGPREKGTYHICEQRRLRRACASLQSRQSLRCSLTQHRELEEVSDKKPHLGPFRVAAQVCLKDLNLRILRPLFWWKGSFYLHGRTHPLVLNGLQWRSWLESPQLYREMYDISGLWTLVRGSSQSESLLHADVQLLQ